jgi:hypothetical protein
MNFPFPPIDVIERCLQDPEKRPICYFDTFIKECNINITNELIKLIDELLLKSPIHRFHMLKELIRNESTTNIILNHSKLCDEQLKHQVEIQESYIWTDNEIFLNELDKIQHKNTNIVKSIKELLVLYIDCIAQHINDVIPKSIMYYLVKQSIDKLYSHLNGSILKSDIHKLLVEDREIENTRQSLTSRENDLIFIQKELLLITSNS